MAKNRLVIIFSLGFLVFGISAFPSGMPSADVESMGPDSISSAPAPDTPLKLREVWLRFHKDNLCEEVDAAFAFHEDQMEVLVNIGDGKNSGKLIKMVETLNDSYRINLRTVKIQTELDLIDIRNTPPSFSVNSRLGEYLRDSFIRDSVIHWGDQTDSTGWNPSIMFGQRLLMFARDTLDYNRKIRLYAEHLPQLARVASDTRITPDLRNQALEVCRAHVKKLEKYTNKLNGNLVMALPKAPKESDKPASPNPPIMTVGSSVDIAVRMADEANDLSRLVYRFIFPQSHTVDFRDLLDPSLLQSLKRLQETTAEFQDSIS